VPPFTFLLFCGKKACGLEGRALCGKSIGSVISDCGLRISDFFGFLSIRIPQSAFRNLEAGPSGATECGIRNVEFGILFFFLTIPHSAFYIPHFGCPPGLKNDSCLMVFSRNALASGPGNA
jgi:hypothetical protein